MKIVEVKQNWPKGYFRIDYMVGNICNYKCWYCFPGSNEGTYKWPEYDLIIKNLSHLLDYYLKNTDIKKFEIHLLGGEVTHWKNFIPFIKYFKENYNCIFTLTSNGSKKIEWWQKAAPYIDQVTLSHHQEFVKKEHLRDVADFLYKSNVLVDISVLMDPTRWEECIESIEYYKKSEKKWSIRYIEVLQDMLNVKNPYTPEQRKVVESVRARGSNIFYYLRVNKIYRSKVTVINEEGKKISVRENQILRDRLNNFYGWECELGVKWLAIKTNGDISGSCSNSLYNSNETYNINDLDFTDKFHPTITTTTCTQSACWCGFETNMFKKEKPSSKKVIPIYAN